MSQDHHGLQSVNYTSTQTSVNDPFIGVGETTFSVANPSGFAVGDTIVFFHPCTADWIDAITNDGGSDPDWDCSLSASGHPYQDPQYVRTITDINGSNEVTINAPLYARIDNTLSNPYIIKYHSAGHVARHVGIEDMRIDIEFNDSDVTNVCNHNGQCRTIYLDTEHVTNAIAVAGAEDAWIRGCTMLHFGYAGVYTRWATRVTVEDSRAIDPAGHYAGSQEGGWRYNFAVGGFSDLILFRNNTANNGRHHYVGNNGRTISGIVFYNNVSDFERNLSEGHGFWQQGFLYDSHTLTSVKGDIDTIHVSLGKSNGGAHGWGAVNSVIWNIDLGGSRVYITKPPMAENYLIGYKNGASGDPVVCDNLSDYSSTQQWVWCNAVAKIETGTPSIASLYEAQLTERNTPWPSPPQDFQVSNAGSIGQNPTLTWTGNSEPDIAHYKIYRWSDIQPQWQVIGTVSSTSYTDYEVVIISKYDADANYSYRITAVTSYPLESDPSWSASTWGEAGLKRGDDTITNLPQSFEVTQSSPNPFSTSTFIHYALPNPSKVRIAVYDVLGREVALVLDRWEEAGYKSVFWQPGDSPSGTYFYRVEAGEHYGTGSMILVR